MPADLHACHLLYARATHVSDSRSAKVVKLQFRYTTFPFLHLFPLLPVALWCFGDENGVFYERSAFRS